MSDHDFGHGPGNVHPAPARTPHPRRLLLVGRIREGEEVQIRYWQSRFPQDAAGIDAVEAFIGSGYYAMTFEIGNADVQRVLAAYFNDPRIRGFHGHLSRFVEGFPTPDQHFGPADAFHDRTLAATGSGDDADTIATSGDLPFAAGMYRWRSGQEPQTGDDPSQPPSQRQQ